MENKGLLGLLAVFWKETGGLIKDIFVGGGESDMLREMGVERGFLASMKYFLILLILPIKVSRFLINPSKEFFEGLTRAIVPFVTLSFALDGNPAVETYEKFVKQFAASENATLTPDLEEQDRFLAMYAFTKILIAFFFTGVVFVGAEVATIVISGLFEKAGVVTALFGASDVFAPSWSSAGSAWVFLGTIIFLFSGVLGVMTLSYIIYFGLKFAIRSAIDVYNIDKNDVSDFLDIVVENVFEKSKELYGEEVARKGYFALKENFIPKEHINLLENSMKFLKKKESK